MAMAEGIKHSPAFVTFLNKILGGYKYKNFEYIVNFIRNVLSHNISNKIRLIENDYKRTAESFIKRVDPLGVAKFEVIYSRDWPEKNYLSKNDYGFAIEIDFSKLKEGDEFLGIVTEWQLFMIMELCRNLVWLYRKK